MNCRECGNRSCSCDNPPEKLNPLVRYAIELPGGMFSGRNEEPVEFAEARLWTQVGHVTNHIRQKSYEELNARVVKVTLTPKFEHVGYVAAIYSRLMLTAAQRKALRQKEEAEARVISAQKALIAAKDLYSLVVDDVIKTSQDGSCSIAVENDLDNE